MLIRDKTIKRAVIKIGSNLLVKDNTINTGFISELSNKINTLRASGIECILVSSGSVACGLDALGLLEKLKEKKAYTKKYTMSQIQAASAVGQGMLIHHYSAALAQYDIKTAQLLVTYDDIHNRHRYLNIKNTVIELLNQKIVPIFNENDTVSVEEITFGDNDYLAALVTHLVNADILVLMSTIDGLLNLNSPNNNLISDVNQIDNDILSLIQKSQSTFGTGGMQSKINAASKLMQTGHMLAIINGQDLNNLDSLFNNKKIGTVFYPKVNKTKHKKLWLGFASKPKGELYIDSGAAKAIIENNKSLLPIGITKVSGNFEHGDIVNIVFDEKIIAKGQTSYNNQEIDKIKGKKSDQIIDILGTKPYDEVILKDNMVVL